MAFSQTVVMASGSPASPSQHTIRASLSPRFFSWVSTFSQNFAPSLSCSQMPRTFLMPSTSTPITRWAALLVTMPLSRTFTRSASM